MRLPGTLHLKDPGLTHRVTLEKAKPVGAGKSAT